MLSVQKGLNSNGGGEARDSWMGPIPPPFNMDGFKLIYLFQSQSIHKFKENWRYSTLISTRSPRWTWKDSLHSQRIVEESLLATCFYCVTQLSVYVCVYKRFESFMVHMICQIPHCWLLLFGQPIQSSSAHHSQRLPFVLIVARFNCPAYRNSTSLYLVLLTVEETDPWINWKFNFELTAVGSL